MTRLSAAFGDTMVKVQASPSHMSVRIFVDNVQYRMPMIIIITEIKNHAQVAQVAVSAFGRILVFCEDEPQPSLPRVFATGRPPLFL